MSLNRRSRALQSPKFAQKRKKKMIGLMVIIILSVVICIGLFILTFRIPFIQVSEVSVSGNGRASETEVVDVVKKRLEGNRLGIFPRSNTFFIPKTEIKKELISTFKDVKNLDIKRKGLSKIEIVIEGRTETVIVCDGFHQDESNENCFLADEEGYVFAPLATSTLPTTQIKYYIVGEKEGGIIGSNFMEALRFKEVMKFVEGSVKAGIAPLGVLIGENDQYEMYVKNPRATASTSPEITVYFDARTPFETTLSNFTIFWNNSFSSNAKSSATSTIDFINLRYGNTIFYSTHN